jgi:macrolide-specific efflux system membrane fusion protein
MIKNKKMLVVIAVIALLAVIFLLRGCGKSSKIVYQKVSPAFTDIKSVISTTGTVEPQNRVEIKPPIDGRLEQILVKEGDRVGKGDILAYMSSTDRAAMLDSARTQGKDAVKYWQEVYKATPLISPISGEVIVRQIEPGQTIQSSTAVLVLSDRLIIKAQVDETDIGRVQVGQKVDISLDAYPDKVFPGKVVHIAYESTMVNNVNIYNVDILPERTAAYLRSGMGANVNILEQEKKNVLALPLEAIVRENGNAYVLLMNGNGKTPIKQPVTLGMTDDKQIEIMDGLVPSAQVLAKANTYQLPAKKKTTGSPFMPSRRPGGTR